MSCVFNEVSPLWLVKTENSPKTLWAPQLFRFIVPESCFFSSRFPHPLCSLTLWWVQLRIKGIPMQISGAFSLHRNSSCLSRTKIKVLSPQLSKTVMLCLGSFSLCQNVSAFSISSQGNCRIYLICFTSLRLQSCEDCCSVCVTRCFYCSVHIYLYFICAGGLG